ncbi:hypothetical protein [Pontibacter liquoris]|uniref:hypothetical protein n=1 Tax=Pontibacter liquoris TaxID=2905677 RepID=UPI001FA721AF|nr:hypothetical protein [Pontibacter liquoris]
MNKEIIIFLTIHLIVPMAGLIFYLRLVQKIKREKVENPPIIDLFLTFATYGGLLLVMLTTFFWEWSAMASLGAFYLTILGPIVMGVIAYKNYKNRNVSKYHEWTYWAGKAYFVFLAVSVLIAFIVEQE